MNAKSENNEFNKNKCFICVQTLMIQALEASLKCCIHRGFRSVIKNVQKNLFCPLTIFDELPELINILRGDMPESGLARVRISQDE